MAGNKNNRVTIYPIDIISPTPTPAPIAVSKTADWTIPKPATSPRRSTKPLLPPSIAAEAIPGKGSGQGSTPGPGSGEGEGNDTVLALIRSRLEKSKYYPPLAERAHITGKVLVRFQIDPNGQPTQLAVSKSSGQDILDQAALTTVKKGAPFPVDHRPLQFWIEFKSSE